MWKNALVSPEATLAEAIRIIDQTGLQIALVTDREGRLLGTLTDGDVRRALLALQSLHEPVKRFMNRRPCCIDEHQSRDEAVCLMKSRRLRQIPVLDGRGRVVDLEIDNALFTPFQLDNWVVIMAGGQGRRLKALTQSCPKPLLKVGRRALLEVIIESLSGQGFKQVYISVNYRADMVMKHFGDGSPWGVKIEYLQENQPLGTAGALGLLPGRPTLPLLLMNGDILTSISFNRLLEHHQQRNHTATVCIKEQIHQIPYGVVNFQGGRLTSIVEKPEQSIFVNAGIYVLNPEVIDHIRRDSYCDIPALLQTLLKERENVGVFPIREYWLDIGRVDDFQKANEDYAVVFE